MPTSSNDGRASLLLKPAEVAAMLGISRSSTYELIAAGAIPAVRLSEKIIRVPRASLNDWIAAKVAEGVAR